MCEESQIQGKRITVVGAGVSGRALAELAAKLGCDVIPGICTRNPDGVTFSMKFYPPMKGRDGEPFGKNIQTSTDDLNAVISEGIKAHPEQWMWMYPRWESVERGIFNDRGN